MSAQNLPKDQKAARYFPKDNKIKVDTIPLPTPKPNELLIKVHSSSLCHSDTMLLEPNEAGLVLGEGTPVTIGHEATGTILSVPDDCTDKSLKVGAKIGFLCPVGVCYECEGCQVHNLHCEKGGVMAGFAADGFFQEYVATHWRNAHLLPDDLDVYTSAPLFCAGSKSNCILRLATYLADLVVSSNCMVWCHWRWNQGGRVDGYSRLRRTWSLG